MLWDRRLAPVTACRVVLMLRAERVLPCLPATPDGKLSDVPCVAVLTIRAHDAVRGARRKPSALGRGRRDSTYRFAVRGPSLDGCESRISALSVAIFFRASGQPSGSPVTF